LNRELPEGWIWTKVGDIYDIVGGGTPSTKNSDYWEGSTPWITSADIHGIMDIRPRKYINGNSINNSATNLVPAGSIIVVTRVGLGKVGLANTELCFSQDSQALVNTSDLIFTKYILYYLEKAVQIFKYKNRGTTIAGVTKKQLYELELPLPPLAEQQRIVDKLEELFTNLDKGIEYLKTALTELKLTRQSVLKYSMEGKLTEKWREENKDKIEPASVLLDNIKEERKKEGKYKEVPTIDTSEMSKLPEGWEWVRVFSIGNVITGNTPRKSELGYYGNDCPFYKPGDLNKGYYVKSSEESISKEGIKYVRLLPEKSVLVTCIGATIGKTGFIRVEGCSNQQINSILPNANIVPEFIYFNCISPQFQNNIVSNSSSTTLPILNKSKFELLPLPIPPKLEQHKIVEVIENYYSILDNMEKSISESLNQTSGTRQSILKKAFEGRLVPQDPNDESASILLEKIKAEKTKSERKTHRERRINISK